MEGVGVTVAVGAIVAVSLGAAVAVGISVAAGWWVALALGTTAVAGVDAGAQAAIKKDKIVSMAMKCFIWVSSLEMMILL